MFLSNTFQTSTFLATAFWKFRKKIMQALDFLHCDHVIKIQCRKSTPCRISFAAVCDLVTFHPCLCKSCIREIFLSSINKNKKYWCFVLPWFSMSMEIEAHQQSSLQWGYKVSWLSICWTWIPHLQNSKVRRRPVWVVLSFDSITLQGMSAVIAQSVKFDVVEVAW